MSLFTEFAAKARLSPASPFTTTLTLNFLHVTYQAPTVLRLMASPPHIPSLNVPRKRPSLAPPGQPSKRRKPSALRQASFPPESNGTAASTPRYSRSPSVESSIAGTTITNGTGGGRKRRRANGEDAQSATGTSVRGGKSGSAIESQNAAAGEQDDEDEEEEGEGMEAVLEGGGKMDEAAEKQEREHMR